MQQGKAGKRDLAEVTKFKEEEGVMYPGCWCKKHDLEGRRIYDAWDIDPEQNEVCVISSPIGIDLDPIVCAYH